MLLPAFCLSRIRRNPSHTSKHLYTSDTAVYISQLKNRDYSRPSHHMCSPLPTGADVGQTARAAAGHSSEGAAEQRCAAGRAVVMATVCGDHSGPEGHGAPPTGNPSAQGTNHRTPGGRDIVLFWDFHWLMSHLRFNCAQATPHSQLKDALSEKTNRKS